MTIQIREKIKRLVPSAPRRHARQEQCEERGDGRREEAVQTSSSDGKETLDIVKKNKDRHSRVEEDRPRAPVTPSKADIDRKSYTPKSPKGLNVV